MTEVGEKIPDLTLTDENGNDVRLYDHIGQHPLVVYFYPMDNTPGCTMEACSFRDYHGEFAAAGAKVYGISGDSVSSHFKFSQKHQLNFSLLSDIHRKAEQAFGVKRNFLGLLPGRVTFVTDVNGIVQYVFNSAVNPRLHVSKALNFLKQRAEIS